MHKHELYVAALGHGELAPDAGHAHLSRVGDEPELDFGDFKFLWDGHVNLTHKRRRPVAHMAIGYTESACLFLVQPPNTIWQHWCQHVGNDE